MRRLALLALCALIPEPTQAAQIEKATLHSGRQMITIIGKLEHHDLEKFEKIIEGMPGDTIVAFHSPGGSLRAGIGIGQLIRTKKFEAAAVNGMTCISACALAWLGGVPRVFQKGTKVGFHAAHKGGVVDGSGNAIVGAYLSEMGMPWTAIFAFTAKGPSEMEWLTEARARELGIEVRDAKETPPPEIAKEDEPAPPRIGLERAMGYFVLAHRMAWSSNLPADWTRMREFYADEVLYHEKQMTGDEVIIAQEEVRRASAN